MNANSTVRKTRGSPLVNLMDELGADNPDLRRSREELTAAVGVEHRESTK
jgi:hypothetical protein